MEPTGIKSNTHFQSFAPPVFFNRAAQLAFDAEFGQFGAKAGARGRSRHLRPPAFGPQDRERVNGTLNEDRPAVRRASKAHRTSEELVASSWMTSASGVALGRRSDIVTADATRPMSCVLIWWKQLVEQPGQRSLRPCFALGAVRPGELVSAGQRCDPLQQLCHHRPQPAALRPVRLIRPEITAKIFLIRWLSSRLSSSLSSAARLPASISVQVPNQRMITPAPSRMGNARPSTQR